MVVALCAFIAVYVMEVSGRSRAFLAGGRELMLVTWFYLAFAVFSVYPRGGTRWSNPTIGSWVPASLTGITSSSNDRRNRNLGAVIRLPRVSLAEGL